METKSDIKDPLSFQHHLLIMMGSKRLTNAMLAKGLGVNPSTVTRLIRGEIPLNAKFALYLEYVSGKKAETWMNYQSKYEIFKLRKMQQNELENQLSTPL